VTYRSGGDKKVLGEDSLHSAGGPLLDDSHTIGNLSIVDNNMELGVVGERQIDRVNQYALKNWRKVNRKKKPKKRIRDERDLPEKDELNDLRKIVKLYKIYGNDKLALVNPVENQGIL
jgi:hypothetical protein